MFALVLIGIAIAAVGAIIITITIFSDPKDKKEYSE